MVTENEEDEKNLLTQWQNELQHNPSLQQDPQRLGLLLVETLQTLDKSKQVLDQSENGFLQLKKRSWLTRLMANNTKDIATESEHLIDAMRLQQHSLQSFMTLLKSVISLNIGNMQFLIKLADNLRSGSNTLKLKDPTLLTMATSMLDEAIKAAEYQEDQINYVKNLLLNEVSNLQHTVTAQQVQIDKLNAKVDKIKATNVFNTFKWPFIFMFVLNLLLILLLIWNGLRH